MSDPAPSDVPFTEPAAALSDRRVRLLVVDDQPINIQTLYQVFAADHQVFMATSGEQALAVARDKQPDLILLDVVMPGMDGHEVCRRLKAEPATRDIPVMFVTAHHDAAAEAEGLDAGAVDFISKPVNPKVVRARVKTHVMLKLQSDLLRRMVFVDGLTGAYNRRFFDEQLAAEWARAVRHGAPLAVLLADVDFFKRYNDRYGHQAGDDVLRRVAAEMRNALKRPGDLAARYGGEEFACVLPETDYPGALQLAQRIEQGVRALAIPHADSDVAPVVTVSVGVAIKPPDGVGSVAHLVREADGQLYVAKSRGRGRACALVI
jgi:diguanylate cyclase (GGDEF)-like protein